MLMPGGERLASQAGEGRSRVGEGVDPDSEPSDPVAAADPDQAEKQDDRYCPCGHAPQHAEVHHHDDANENFEEQDELALSHQIGLARGVNQLGNFEHRSMHRQILELHVLPKPEDQPEDTNHQSPHQNATAIDSSHDRDLGEIREHQIRFVGPGAERSEQPEYQSHLPPPNLGEDSAPLAWSKRHVCHHLEFPLGFSRGWPPAMGERPPPTLQHGLVSRKQPRTRGNYHGRRKRSIHLTAVVRRCALDPVHSQSRNATHRFGNEAFLSFAPGPRPTSSWERARRLLKSS